MPGYPIQDSTAEACQSFTPGPCPGPGPAGKSASWFVRGGPTLALKKPAGAPTPAAPARFWAPGWLSRERPYCPSPERSENINRMRCYHFATEPGSTDRHRTTRQPALMPIFADNSTQTETEQNRTKRPLHNQQLFDDLGGAQHDRWGYGKAERLSGLEVHDHLKLGRELHREIARLPAAQDAIDIRWRRDERCLRCRLRSGASRRLWQRQDSHRPPVRCFGPPPI